MRNRDNYIKSKDVPMTMEEKIETLCMVKEIPLNKVAYDAGIDPNMFWCMIKGTKLLGPVIIRQIEQTLGVPEGFLKNDEAVLLTQEGIK